MSGLAAAIAARDPDLLPSRRDEDWRWTGLRELIRFVPEPSPVGETLSAGPWAGVHSDELLVVNGRPLNFPGLIQIGPGDRPTAQLRFISTADAGSHAPHIRIVVREGADFTLLESYEGAPGGAYVASAELEIDLAEGSSLTRLILADEPDDAVSVSRADIALGAKARLQQTVLATGARRQRFETHIAHPGQGANVRLDGAYVLAAKLHSDQTTVVTHAGEGGVTNQLTKGVATDQARGVFQGRIVVKPGADGTDARMGHHALLLSDRAEVDAKPELEIYADDVQCAHGNTVGALSDEAIFYARSRGITEPEARVMLTAAFLGEVVERIEHEPAREIARAWVEAKLGALGR